MDKRHWPAFVILQCFCRGTCPFCHVGAEVFLQHVTVWRTVHIFYYFFCFHFTDVLSVHGWRCIPVSAKSDPGEVISTLLKSQVGSTAKRYKKEILKFIDYVIFAGFLGCLLLPLRI